MSFEVQWSATARDDLVRLHEFLLQRASCVEDLELASRAVDAITEAANSVLARTPYSCRKAGRDQLWRELVIPFGRTGYVALYEILRAKDLVLVHAVRHQREEDYQ